MNGNPGNQIYFVRPYLAVCGFAGLINRQSFELHHFEAQLQCASGFESWLETCLEVKSLPFYDGYPVPADIFWDGQQWLNQQLAQNRKTLVSCAAGQSRSVTMVTAALHLFENTPFLDAAWDVCTTVSESYPHPDVLISAAGHCGAALSFEELRCFYDGLPAQPLFPWTDDLIWTALQNAGL